MTNALTSSTLWLPGMDPSAPIYNPPKMPTLEAYFEHTFLNSENTKRLSRSRINELRLAVSRFIWWAREKQRIDHPLLSDVTPRRLAMFRDEMVGVEMPAKLGKSQAIKAGPLNKSLGALQQLVNSAAEVEDGLTMVKVKKISMPSADAKLIVPDDSIEKLFVACDQASWPTDDGSMPPAATLWKFLICWWTNYGMRTQELAAYEERKSPMTWQMVTETASVPHEGELTCPHGWFYFVQQKTKRIMILPMNEATRYWLGRLGDETPSGRDPARPIVPLPKCPVSFYSQWRSIVECASVLPRPKMQLIDGAPTLIRRKYHPKNFRCTAGTRADNHGATLNYTNMGRLITGHKTNDVFENHYRDNEKRILDTVLSLPQPTGFLPPRSPNSSAGQTNNPTRHQLRVVG